MMQLGKIMALQVDLPLANTKTFTSVLGNYFVELQLGSFGLHVTGCLPLFALLFDDMHIVAYRL